MQLNYRKGTTDENIIKEILHKQAYRKKKLDFKIEKDDVLFNKTVIDKQSLEIIAGSTVDFKKEMIGETFVINNPKASASCGCGLSFSV